MIKSTLFIKMLHRHISTCRHFIIRHHKYAWVFTAFAIVIVGGVYFKKEFISATTANTFTQSSWTGGLTGGTATHTTSQSNWAEYSATSSGMNVGATMSLSLNSFYFTDDGATSTTSTLAVSGGTFSAGTNESTAVTGSGEGASVELLNTVSTVNTLVVAGGGSGSRNGSGGGGAGGYRANATFAVTPQAYTITVGAGAAGAASDGAVGNNGGASTFDTITSIGGGGGGHGGNGLSGGSGGGSGYHSSAVGGDGTGGQGNNGGHSASANGAPDYPGGGGGGSSAVGGNASSATGGVGGAGTYNSISGASVAYAGGGAGGGPSNSAGGVGGGGAGSSYLNANNTAGEANTGGGGGSGGSTKAGGSGIVIISFPTDGSTGVSTSSTGGDITTFGGNQIHTFLLAQTGTNFTMVAAAGSTSGTFTSAVINLGTKATSTTLTSSSTVHASTTLTIDIRGGNIASTTDNSNPWTSWQASGASGSNGGGSNIPQGYQYIQYRANLTTEDTAVTPTLDSVTINYNQYALGDLTSSVYNTSATTTLISKIAWTATGTSTDETIKFQVRSSPNGTNEWSNWCGYVDCSGDTYFDNTKNGVALEGGHTLNSGGNDRYLQYKVFLTSGGALTPILTGVTVTYSFDSTPPVITRIGGNISIYVGTAYTEAGVSATDTTDGNVAVVTEGSVDTATIGIYTITYTATDAAGNTATSTRTVTVLAVPVSAQLLTDNTTVSTDTPQILVGSNNTATSTITIPDSVTNATINVAALTTSTDTSTTATLLGAIVVNAVTSIGSVSMEIPAGITITAASSTWDGTINDPQVRPNSSVTAIPDSGKIATVFSVIEVGYGDIKLTFNKAVRLVFVGQAGKDAGYSRSGVFTKIGTTCSADTQTAGNALPTEGDCKRSVGSDLIVWTKHFTNFVTYTQIASAQSTVTSSSGSYMVQHIPAPVSVVHDQKPAPAQTPKSVVPKPTLAPNPVPTIIAPPTVEPVPDTIVEPILEPVLTPEPTPVSEIKQSLMNKVISNIMSAITSTVSTAIEYIGSIWESIKGWFVR